MPPSEIDRQKLRNAYRSPHMKLVMDYFATSTQSNDMEIEVDILEEYFKDNPFFGRASIIDSFKILEKFFKYAYDLFCRHFFLPCFVKLPK